MWAKKSETPLGDVSPRNHQRRGGSLLLRLRLGHLGGRGRWLGRGRRSRRGGRGAAAAAVSGHDGRLAAGRSAAGRRSAAIGWSAAIAHDDAVAATATTEQFAPQTQETAVATRAAVAARATVASVTAIATMTPAAKTQEAATMASMRHRSADTRVSRAAVAPTTTTERQVIGRTRHRHHQHDTVHSTNLPQK